MRNLIATAAAILLLAACGNQNGNQQTQKEAPVPQREGITFGELILADTNEFGGALEALIPYTTTNGTSDTLNINLLYEMDKETCELFGVGMIEEADINFDGTKDLQIRVGNFNAAGNTVYEGFVWNNETGTFVCIPEYYDIFDPEINEENKSISGSFREWMDGVEYVEGTVYKWVNDTLTLTDQWSEEFTLDDEE